MKQSINNYTRQANQFSTLSDTIHGSWQDNVGDAFYRDIINPIKDLSSNMVTAMEDLSSRLYQIKEEIDKI